MVDLTVTALDPPSGNRIRYELGSGNWASGWVPRLAGGGELLLAERDRIDVLLLGDGFKSESDFRQKLDQWIEAFFEVEVYQQLRGAFRIRALYTQSVQPATKDRGSYYGVAMGADGVVRDPKWWNLADDLGIAFRRRLWDSINAFGDMNLRQYPDDVEDSKVIHNPLSGLYSHLVVMMLVKTPGSSTGMTRRVEFGPNEARGLNVGFGENSLHEFGHAFAYLEDEYIQERGVPPEGRDANPAIPSVYNISNLSFEKHVDRVPWLHVSPWGLTHRQAAGNEPSPIVGWLWRGGEQEFGVWHSEYQCLMNGKHQNYAYTPNGDDPTFGEPPSDCDRVFVGGADLRWRHPPTYCLWCQEIVVIRTLEKTGVLATPHDDPSIDVRGRDWYRTWVAEGRGNYWEFFDVAARIGQHEVWYANPSVRADDMCQLKQLDGTYLRLDTSPLYQVFDAAPVVTAASEPPDDGEELLVVTA
ncbi:hypothetical protein VST63_03010 [Mycolicibacterium sp. 050232]|uniref:hypothetical protein n=1 Tax=Mycolicibacterium sp. 050232 TaxID=3113982 RepID=UPI002E2DF281|nr:hypothetical protein [Mycolicibacterium sp. 050232]MED5811318.1 hypothetical protein [Mycolicibacterium sp. 050232]